MGSGLLVLIVFLLTRIYSPPWTIVLLEVIIVLSAIDVDLITTPLSPCIPHNEFRLNRFIPNHRAATHVVCR